jgi:DNA-binding Lrp family transcriptional regulator
MRKFTKPGKKALAMLQRDLPVTDRPFDSVAAQSGLSAASLTRLLTELKGAGLLRRFGAILRHHKAGYRTNALVVWSLEPEAMESAGLVCASNPSISHCYERRPSFLGKYNLFTMLHTQNTDLSSVIDELSASINCSDFLVLESLQEFKKTSPEYF